MMKLLRYVLVFLTAMALMGAPQGPKKAPAKAADAAATAKGPLVDINAASEADLKALPGIGDAYSSKIIAGRPYRAKNQLDQKKIIPHATYEKIKEMIIAKQPSDPKKK